MKCLVHSEQLKLPKFAPDRDAERTSQLLVPQLHRNDGNSAVEM